MNHNMYTNNLPTRVRVLILGGGIHGVGLLHDMASRGWKDVHLIEKATLASGTSSKSTKLIHGGLRYLQHIRDFGLVAEALHERTVLQSLAGDIVTPLQLLLPVLKRGGMPGFMLRSGLTLYDLLAGKHKIARHQRLRDESLIHDLAPLLSLDEVKSVLSFWDMQTDDLALVRRVAASAAKLGAGVTEGVEAVSIAEAEHGWRVDVRKPDGSTQSVSALYVFNALGPWANRFLEASRMTPSYHGVNSKGVHLLLDDIGLKAGLFLQSPEDKRIFFVLPWQGKTLVGTTEDLYADDPDRLSVGGDEVGYLLQHCNRYLTRQFTERDVRATFAGLRWLAVDNTADLNNTSRAYVIGEKSNRRGLLMTLYGGKLTTYRNLSRIIGDRICTHFGEFHPSGTHEKANWATKDEVPGKIPTAIERFNV